MTKAEAKKAERKTVFNMFCGRCAYCGEPITLNSFEVDHIEALRRADDYGGEDVLQNMYPACVPCNRGKSTRTIEQYRTHLESMINSLNRDSATYRACKRHELIIETERKIVFYFEKF